METIGFWPALLFVMLCALLLGYSLLDGFDLGLSMLLPLIPKADDRRVLLAAMAPFWDGNEVWLIIAGGVLFAAFPAAYATILSGFYLPVMFVLFALILRAVAFEFWPASQKGGNFWQWVLSAASLLVTGLFGLLLGNLLRGIPLDAEFTLAGGELGLFRPLPVAVGATAVAVFVFQGLAFAVGKTAGELQQTLLKTARRAWWICSGVILVLWAALAASLPAVWQRPLLWLGILITAGALAGARLALIRRGGKGLLAFSSAALAGLWLSLAGIQFPLLVRSIPPARSMTIAAAATAGPTLRLIAAFTFFGMLLVAAYSWFVYRVFRGRARAEESY